MANLDEIAVTISYFQSFLQLKPMPLFSILKESVSQNPTIEISMTAFSITVGMNYELCMIPFELK